MSFELQPHLVGNLVELRPLTPDDYDAVYEAGKDPLIWQQHPQSDRYKSDLFRKYFDGGIESGGAFAVIQRATGRIIGCTRYCNLKPAESEVEIGWTFLERAFWGGTVNGEMKSLMLDHAFRFVERVVFVIGENNRRSRKAVEKIGGTLYRGPQKEPGRPDVPFVVYALTRSQYAAAAKT
jgi:RimJ/RimL family protein N-acetyltransferase